MSRLTARQIADAVQGELVGDGDIVLSGVAALDDASAEQLSFLANGKYAKKVLPSAAGCVIVPPEFDTEPPAGRAWIRCQSPSRAFGEMVEQLLPAPNTPAPGVHPSAVVDPSARLGSDVHVGPCAVIAADAVIGDRSIVEAGSYVGHDAVLGADCRLWPNVTVRERCVLGDRVIIHSGTTVGSDGFGYEPSPTGHRKIAQRGIVQIDSDVEIGANCAIDRARFGRTWIKAGAKIDNLVQIAHNVEIGELSGIVAQVGIAGSTTVGRGVLIFGQAGLGGHIQIGDGVTIMGQSGVDGDVPAGQTVLGGPPAMPKRQAFRLVSYQRKLPEMAKQLKALEAELAALREQLGQADDTAPDATPD